MLATVSGNSLPMSYTISTVTGSAAACVGSLMAQTSDTPTVAQAGMLIGMAGLVTAIGSVLIPLAKIFKDSATISAQLADAKAEATEAKNHAEKATLAAEKAAEDNLRLMGEMRQLMLAQTARQLRHTDANRDQIAALNDELAKRGLPPEQAATIQTTADDVAEIKHMVAEDHDTGDFTVVMPKPKDGKP